MRDVAVVVLDEATARMDPQSERRVSRATDRLLAGRTGIVIAHRLTTTRRCDAVAVLDRGRVVQHGDRAQLAAEPGPFRELLAAAGDSEPAAEPAARFTSAVRRAPKPAPPPARPSLARAVVRTWLAHPRWGVLGGVAFLVASLVSAHGAVTGWLWGRLVSDLEQGVAPWAETAALAATLLLAPPALALAFRTYPQW